MGVGPNYLLDKGMLAQGSTAYAYGELVVPGTAEQSVARATTAGAPLVFVCQEDLDATRLATGKAIVGTRFFGLARVIVDAAVTKGDKLVNNANARAIKQATAGSPTFGVALTAATAAGQYVDVLLTPGAFA